MGMVDPTKTDHARADAADRDMASVRAAQPWAGARAPALPVGGAWSCMPSPPWPRWPVPWLVGRLVDDVSGRGTAAAGRPPRGDARRDGRRCRRLLTWAAATRVVRARRRPSSPSCASSSSGRAVNLPLSTVERAGTGDLVARTTNDVEAARARHPLRHPGDLRGVGDHRDDGGGGAAHVAAGHAAAAPAALPLYWLSTRRYLRAPATATCGSTRPTPASTAWSPRPSTGRAPIDALVAAGRPAGGASQTALGECDDAEQYTLGLRLRWFPFVEFGFFLPSPDAVLWGGWLAWNGHITAGGRHRRDALHPAAARPARRAPHRGSTRSSSRRHLAGPHHRGRRGAARPRRHRGAARRRPARRRRRALRLPRAAATCCTASRLDLVPGRAARHRRPLRGRQVDAGPPHGRASTARDRPR